MGKVLAVVRRCRDHFTSDVMKMVLGTLVFSQLDYCQIMRANATKNDSSKLQLVHNKTFSTMSIWNKY